RRRVLSHIERILIPHVYDPGADLDPARRGADRGQQRERRGELASEVMDAEEGTVDADLLSRDRQFDRLPQRLSPGLRLRPLPPRPVAEAEEPDALAVRCVVTHA